MRVLVVTPWFPTIESPGVGIFNLRDVELISQTHDVHVVHLQATRSEDFDYSFERISSNISVTRIPFSTPEIATYVRMRQMLRRQFELADLVHTMAFPALLPVKFARGWRFRSLPWVHTEHWSGLTLDVETLRTRLAKRILTPLLKAPDEVVAVGEKLARAIEARRGRAVPIIGNKVALADPTTYLIENHFGHEGEVRLIGVGNLISWKGPLLAVETIAKLREEGIEASLKWAGVGPLADQIAQLANDLDISDHVALLGHLSPKALSEELLNSDIFILPTEGETFGVSIAEALGHGLPVVTSGAGEHEHFLPRRASRIVQHRTSDALSSAVVDLLQASDKWSRSEIYTYASGVFSEGDRQRQYAEIYARAARSRQ